MPSEKILQQKVQSVTDLAEKLGKAQTIVLADYRGLTVAQDTELRTALRNGNVEYKVVKNTLTRRALEQNGVDGLDEYLNGPTAIAFCDSDVIAPAKILAEYAKKFEKLEIKAGVIEGKAASLNEINDLASIPSKEVLIGQLLGLLTSPMRGLAVGLNAVAEQKSDGEAPVEAEAAVQADTDTKPKTEENAAETPAE